jgi:L,D-peptidoglycan transpeptidase YkuD (ErfK/YbiS/YcfS/YnhG family)
MRSFLLALLVALGGCASLPQAPLDSAEQLVLVTTPGWDAPAGQLRRFERDGADWREVGEPVAVTIGRAGAAWGLGLNPPQADGPQKREGDGRSPAGIYAIGEAFGYPERVETGLDYHGMRDSEWCVDVVGSPLYNRIVDTRDVGEAAVKGSSEPMRRDIHVNGDQRYRIGFVIEHNVQGKDRGGSCIFAHVWKAPGNPTAGCTAMTDEDMQQLLRWLDKRRIPRFVLLPQAEYERLKTDWQLP